jgi:hypothetical protein
VIVIDVSGVIYGCLGVNLFIANNIQFFTILLKIDKENIQLKLKGMYSFFQTELFTLNKSIDSFGANHSMYSFFQTEGMYSFFQTN